MALNLIKLCVGIDSAEHLKERHAERMRSHGRLFAHTRMIPKRTEELLDGGSLYWVIKGFTGVRQPILDIELYERDEEGRPYCLIILGPAIHVAAYPRRPFQGWRYLKPEEAPPDVGGDAAHTPPPAEMAAQLRALGLL